MKLVALIVLLAVVIGGLVGTLIGADAGYVLVTIGDVVFETSFWVALLLLGLLGGLVYAGLWLAAFVGRGGSQLSLWQSRRKRSAWHEQTLRGLLIYAEQR